MSKAKSRHDSAGLLRRTRAGACSHPNAAAIAAHSGSETVTHTHRYTLPHAGFLPEFSLNFEILVMKAVLYT